MYVEDIPAKDLVTLYSTDGKTLTIHKNLEPKYLKKGWYKERPVTMYALDGRTLWVIPSEIQAYKNVGWYEEPMVTLYAADGRSQSFPKSEVAAQKTVGWFDEPLVTMYAYDGRSQKFLKSEVEAQKTVGWYTEPFVTMYALDGRSQKFPKSEVAAQKTVGWYESQSEINNYYANQQAKQQENLSAASKFYVGAQVAGSMLIYNWYGTVQQVSNGKVLVNWDSFYTSDGMCVTNPFEIIMLESKTGVYLNEPVWYDASDLYLVR